MTDRAGDIEGFVHTVTHDLRAPLRAMSGFATALLEDFSDALGPRGRDYAVRIVRASEHMDRLLADLKRYGQQFGRPIRQVDVDLQQTVSDALWRLRGEVGRSGAHVAVDGAMPGVTCDPEALTDALEEVLGNALKFVRPGERPDVRVTASTSGSQVVIAVDDSGIGIDAQHRDEVFGVFERLHGPEAYPGTGIGLAVVRKIAERMGARYGIEGSASGGSRFWIELSSREPQTETPAEPAETP